MAFLETLVLSAFSFTFAPELVVITAGEMQSPRRNLPKAAKRYFHRLVIFYILGVIAIGVTCPFNDARLTQGGGWGKGLRFCCGYPECGNKRTRQGCQCCHYHLGMVGRQLVVIHEFQVPVLPSGCGECTGHLQEVLQERSTIHCCCMQLALFASGLSKLRKQRFSRFGWFVNLTNTSGFISWICCCITFLRFRKACQVQGVTDLPYQSFLHPIGSWIALVFFVFLTLVNGFDVFFPGRLSASSFLTAYVGIPISLGIYLIHRTFHWKDEWLRRPEDVDLVTSLEEVLMAEKPPPVRDTWWKKIQGSVT